MASSSSSSSPRTWEYNVFTSFHGPDVRKTLLSHLRKQFSYNGITMFNDNGIERSQIIAPALTKAIGESRIAIVLLSKNYASSSWCLDELLEILKCKEELGQIVMTVFYGVDPSDVRKQTGDFGIAFNETCARKTEEQRRKWSQALTYVGNIAGEDFKNWDNEAEMIEKIAGDVSDKVNATPCRDFDGMVGLDDHLRKMEYLLDLDNLGVKIVGISGPAGIGKSTIARALHSRLSSKFQHNCFVDNLWENYKIGSGEHGVKLRLHGKLLSELLNINHMQISHLGVIKDRLHDKKVLIILDDVESLAQLEALADITWFGPGSRVIVTTENRKILQQHSISDSDIYHVGFPSESKAVMIFCLSAFKQTSPPDGFMNLTYEVVRICGNLPLALSVLGSSLRGKGQDDWFDELPRLRNRLDGRIESVLKVGYESLDEKDQALFLLIAVFFNYKHVDYVTSMLENTNVVDVRLGLKNLADRHLIHKYRGGVVMHRLLQVMAREVMSKEKISKRKILEDPQDICYVLQEAKGKGSTLAVSLDVGKINELKVNKKAFKRMSNLLILKVFDGMHFDWMHFDGMHRRESKLHVPEEMEFPPSLRLLHWVAYPSKSLRFRPENLIKLYMPDSQLEKLWEGTQPLANLKKMDLSLSFRLKVLPDLSKATNLEELDVSLCYALEEIPSSVSNLHKLVKLEMDSCDSLEVIPTLVNLASMKRFKLSGCSRLRSFPDVPTSLTELLILNTWLEELPASFRHCSRLRSLQIRGRENLKIFATHLPTSVTELNLSNSVHIERITDCIKGLNNLTQLDLSYCRRLVSLPELPGSLKWLSAENCTSLERVSDPLNTPHATLYFMNCIKLDRQAREAIIKQSFVPLDGWALIPGREIPTEFDHRTTGNSLTIHHSAFNRFVKVCVVISSIRNHRESTAHTEYSQLWYRCRVSNNLEISVVKNFILSNVSDFLMDHLIIFHASLPFFEHSEASRDIVLQFSSEEPFHQQRYSAPIFNIIECGVQILTDEPDRSNNGGYDLLWDTSKSKSSEALDKEDDEEGDKSESGEGSEDIDEDIDETDRFNNGGYDLLWDTSESESSEASDKEDDEEGDKSESGEASEDIDEDITNEGDYEYVSRKRPRTTMITDLKWGIQRRRF